MPEAIAEARGALRIKPDYPEALVNLASFLTTIPGRLPDAIAEYQGALDAFRQTNDLINEGDTLVVLE